MSSGTSYEPGLVRRLLGGLAQRTLKSVGAAETAQQTNDRVARLGLSPRQQRLNYLWAWHRCETYSGRRVDWNGGTACDPIETEAIASQGTIPPGFYDAGSTMPIKFRRPSAPYPLVRVIVDRFTGLLFSEKRHPTLKVESDPDTEAYLGALVDSGRLWALMLLARQYGGAMGSACVGFQFVEGRIVIEVHDPRWVQPTFADRMTHKLKSIEKRYMYPVEQRDAAGVWREEAYWYRRIIDEEKDVLFNPVPVGDGDEPDWAAVGSTVVEHGLGFCPVVWAQNLPVQDDVDGDPDCHGVYEMIAAIDALIAQANKGIVANCDPTLSLITDAEMSDVKKGSDNAIKLPTGSSSSYIEISGSGPKAALDLAGQLRGFTLESAQCVLERPDMSRSTATEIERAFSSMLAKADVLREQYGQKLVLVLAEMMLAAVQKLKETKTTDPLTGETVRAGVILPKRKVIDPETGETSYVEPKLGKGGSVSIQWPHYFEPLLSDVELATRAAIAARTGGVLDLDHAVQFVAEYYDVEDVQALIARLKSEAQGQQQAMMQQAMGMLGGEGVPGGPEQYPEEQYPEEPTSGSESYEE